MGKIKNEFNESSLMQSWFSRGLAAKPNDERHDQSLHDKYHFDEWVLGPEERDGQKNKLKIRAFDDQSYNGPRLEDFLKRLDAIYNTAIAEIDNNDQLENKEELKKVLAQYKELKVGVRLSLLVIDIVLTHQ